MFFNFHLSMSRYGSFVAQRGSFCAIFRRALEVL